MKKLAIVLITVLISVLFAGCSGGGDSADKELKGKVESTEIQSAPGDQRPDGGGERDGDK